MTDKNAIRRSFKNKKNKVHVLFDEEDRRNFLTGFKKRKDERRQKAQEQMLQKLKEEKRRLKQMRRDIIKKNLNASPGLVMPDTENLMQPVSYSTENHVVTITPLNEIDFIGSTGTMLGQNKIDANNDSEKCNDPNEHEEDDPQLSLHHNAPVNRYLKKLTKKFNESKVVKMKNKMKQKSDKQKAKRKFIRNGRMKIKKKNQSRKVNY